VFRVLPLEAWTIAAVALLIMSELVTLAVSVEPELACACQPVL